MRFTRSLPSKLAHEQGGRPTKKDLQPSSPPVQRSRPLPPHHPGLLHFPAEVRLNVYRFLTTPQETCIDIGLRQQRVRCISSRTFPLLGTSSQIRKEVLAYLLSQVKVRLCDGIRPRLRHTYSPLPIWHLLHVQHVSIDMTRKMQFEIFGKLKTLTLRWDLKPLIMIAPLKWQRNLTGYLWSSEGALAMTETMRSALESHAEQWVHKLAGRHKKNFQLRLQATVGSEDREGAKSESLIVSYSVPILDTCADLT
jgi:hypothetical protein